MANMAYFNGSLDTSLYTALTVPAAHFDWGTGDFKFSFKMLTVQVPAAGTTRVITWDRIVLVETGAIAVASSGGGLISATAVNDGVEHTIIVERIAGRLAISIDGSESSHEDSDVYDWTVPVNMQIGVSAGMPPNTYEGLLGEFKIYKGSGGSQTLELDLPLVSDVVDVSPNGLTVADVGVTFLAPAVTVTLEPQITNTLDDAVHGITGDVLQTDSTSLFGQDINVTGYSSTMNTFESAIVFPANIPAGATIVEAFLYGYGIDLAGFSDAGVKCRISLENNLNPSAWSDYANYAPRRANVGTAFVDWDGATISHGNWNKSPELKTLIQELANTGEIQKLAFFLNDNGSSDMNAYGLDGISNGLKLWVTYQESTAVPFISTWNTPTDAFAITLPLISPGTYDFIVDWGDLTPTDHITIWNQAEATHTYATAGDHTITITGIIEGIQFNSSPFRSNIIEISQWGDLKLGNYGWYFYECSNLTITATDTLNLSGTTDFTSLFYGCTSLTTIPNIDLWDVSSVTNMTYMFYGVTAFNQDISGWDVSSVTNMSYMFLEAAAFNQDISGWNVSSVTDMSGMFLEAAAFNQNISGWDTSSVTTMSSMLSYATAFNQDISGLDISSVTDMSSMFEGANFNQDISGWDVSNVTNMSYMFADTSIFNQNIGSWVITSATDISGMFYNATAFNQDISGWDTSNVTTMIEMFYGATLFNQNISSWVTTNVTDMSYMFAGAVVFNQDISGWDTSSVTTMMEMFNGATLFNQNLSGWNVEKVITMENMFTGSALSTSNYDEMLNSWSGQTVQSGVVLGADCQYSPIGKVGRDILTGTYLWVITDGGISGYTITYNANGGTGTPPVDSSSPYDTGSTVTVKANTDLTYTGKEFAGWNTLADGSGTFYDATDTFVISGNITLYAIYGKRYYKNDVVTNIISGDRSTYWCLVEHLSRADNEPGVGANWATYWGCGVDMSAKLDKEPNSITIKSTVDKESAPLGDELLSASGWTSTGWTGDWASGWKHTTGNTTALLNSLPAVVSDRYAIIITHTATAGSIILSFGGVQRTMYYNAPKYINTLIALTTDGFSLTPSSDYNGTCYVSIKLIIGVYDPIFIVQNSGGGTALEIRSTLYGLSNTFIGKNAGAGNVCAINVPYGSGNTAIGDGALQNGGASYNTIAIGYNALNNAIQSFTNIAIGNNSMKNVGSGFANLAVGSSALQSVTTGNYNHAIGLNSLYTLTTGSYNHALGYNALMSLTTGSGNIGIGYATLRDMTTGDYNIAIGYLAGRYYGSGTSKNLTSTYSTYIGYQTRAGADGDTKEIVIGYNNVGNGSNTATLGDANCIGWYKGSTLMVDQSIAIGSSPSFASVKLTTGAGAGKILISDTDGNASWGIPNHNDLANIQGGSVSPEEYYHMTADEYDYLKKLKDVYFTANDSLSVEDCQRTNVSNYGMTDADCTIDLPTAEEGLAFIAVLPTVRAKFVHFNPVTGDSIYLSGVTTGDGKYVGVASGYAVATSAQFFTFKNADGGYDWFCLPIFGTWAAEA